MVSMVWIFAKKLPFSGLKKLLSEYEIASCLIVSKCYVWQDIDGLEFMPKTVPMMANFDSKIFSGLALEGMERTPAYLAVDFP